MVEIKMNLSPSEILGLVEVGVLSEEQGKTYLRLFSKEDIISAYIGGDTNFPDEERTNKGDFINDDDEQEEDEERSEEKAPQKKLPPPPPPPRKKTPSTDDDEFMLDDDDDE